MYFTAFVFFVCFRQEEVMKVRKYQQDLRQRGLEKVTIVYLFVIFMRVKCFDEGA